MKHKQYIRQAKQIINEQGEITIASLCAAIGLDTHEGDRINLEVTRLVDRLIREHRYRMRGKGNLLERQIAIAPLVEPRAKKPSLAATADKARVEEVKSEKFARWLKALDQMEASGEKWFLADVCHQAGLGDHYPQQNNDARQAYQEVCDRIALNRKRLRQENAELKAKLQALGVEVQCPHLVTPDTGNDGRSWLSSERADATKRLQVMENKKLQGNSFYREEVEYVKAIDVILTYLQGRDPIGGETTQPLRIEGNRGISFADNELQQLNLLQVG